MADGEPLGIAQLELTSFCDMKCSYCPHPTMKRGKGHMSAETLQKCIEQAKRRGQPRLVLHHFGEPLLHPRLKERLAQVVASGLNIQFSTNGLMLEERLPILLETPGKIAITLSMHQWAKQDPKYYFNALKGWQHRTAGTHITFLPAFNVMEGDTSYTLHKWANGDRMVWDYNNLCTYLKRNWGVVLWDGTIVSCCVDSEGESIIGISMIRRFPICAPNPGGDAIPATISRPSVSGNRWKRKPPRASNTRSMMDIAVFAG